MSPLVIFTMRTLLKWNLLKLRALLLCRIEQVHELNVYTHSEKIDPPRIKMLEFEQIKVFRIHTCICIVASGHNQLVDSY